MATVSRTTQTWATRILGAFAVFVVANVAAAAIGTRLAEPLTFSRPMAQIKDDQIHDLADEFGCIDAVVAGNSLAGFGLDPAVFTREVPTVTSTYNAALTGSVARIETDWMDRFVLPRLKPTVILYVVTSVTFSSKARVVLLAQDDWDNALDSRTGVIAGIDRVASGWLPLVKYRGELADPAEWERLLSGDPPPDLVESTFDVAPTDITTSMGHISGVGEYDPADPSAEGTRQFAKDLFLDTWSIDPAEVESLRGFVQAAQADGTEVVFVLPPVTDDYIALHPAGRQDWNAYLQQTNVLAAELGVPVIDETGLGLANKQYVDTHHLNADGAAVFSQAVARDFNQLGLPTPRCTP